MALTKFKLGDDEQLSFGFNWQGWLEGVGENVFIANSSWVVPEGLSLISESSTVTSTLAVIACDTALPDESFTVTNIITTNSDTPLIAERSFVIKVVETKGS